MTVVVAQTPVGLDSLIGQIVAGRYRILDKLGAGGMGTVFRAEQVSVRRQIALKVLDPALSFEPEIIKRFHAEAEVAARLSHPNTVTLFDFGQDETGRMYIAMELASGRSLREVIAREAPLQPGRAVHILEQIASSLADAHDHGIIHRDMKPDNVMLQDRAGVSDFARVLDFGIAKLYDQTSTLAAGREPMTRAGQILGTPQYMAPEQISGTPVDGRTDIYALGIMVYEMLTARLPFTAPTMMALLAMHLHDPPRPIRDWRPDLPPMLAGLVMRCLEKNPAGRPANMRALLQELASVRGSMGVPTPNPAYRTPPPATPGYGTPAAGYATPPPPGYSPPSGPGFGTPAPPAAWPAPTPAPLSMPPPPPPPLPRQSGGSGKTMGIIAGVVAAAIAAGVTVFFVTRPPGDTPSDPPVVVPPAPQEPSSPSGPSTPSVPPVPDKTFRSSRYGYSMILPGSIAMTENTSTGASFGQGHIDGSEVAIAVVPSVNVTDVQALARTLIQAADTAKVLDTRTRIIRDTDILSVVYEVEGQGRLESCLMPGSQPFLVTIVTKPGDFDKLALFRDSLFRDRFQMH